MFKPELLSPAGTIKNMRYAFAYGADAVYAGQPRYSLRVRNNDFNIQNLNIGIKEAHKLGKKFFLVVNIAPHNSKLKTFIKDIHKIIEMNPDALIISDPGLIMLTRENFPSIPIHLSVQANTINWAAVKFWQRIGLTRVILSRELSLEEIEEIRTHVPEIEIEIFVHGSLCIAYSGRCLISGYMNKRDANQGACTNACRWKYNVKEVKENYIDNIIYEYKDNTKIIDASTKINTSKDKSNSKLFIIKDIERSGKCMTAFQDEHGSYILNSKDLRAVMHVEKLKKIGVHSLKIEGRTKSFYYCARTAQVYRKAIDDAYFGKPFDKSLLKDLDGLANRGYTEGFLRRHNNHEYYQNYDSSFSYSKYQQFVGEFTGERKGELVNLKVKNKFSIGNQFELMTPKGNFNFVLNYMENSKGKLISIAPGDGHNVWLPVSENIKIDYALLIRNIDKDNTY